MICLAKTTTQTKIVMRKVNPSSVDVKFRTEQSVADDTSKGKCQVNCKHALFLDCQSCDRWLVSSPWHTYPELPPGQHHESLPQDESAPWNRRQLIFSISLSLPQDEAAHLNRKQLSSSASRKLSSILSFVGFFFCFFFYSSSFPFVSVKVRLSCCFLS